MTGLFERIDAEIAPVHPPASPLRKRDRIGLAFDRNLHEDLAPTDVWTSLFDVFDGRCSGAGQMHVVREDARGVPGADRTLGADLVALRAYWDDDHAHV